MPTTTGLLITDDGDSRTIEIGDEFTGVRDIRELLNDDFEVILGAAATIVFGEHSKIAEPPLPMNRVASSIAIRIGWLRAAEDYLAGPVLFFGPSDGAAFTSIKPELAAAIRDMTTYIDEDDDDNDDREQEQ